MLRAWLQKDVAVRAPCGMSLAYFKFWVVILCPMCSDVQFVLVPGLYCQLRLYEANGASQ